MNSNLAINRSAIVHMLLKGCQSVCLKTYNMGYSAALQFKSSILDSVSADLNPPVRQTTDSGQMCKTPKLHEVFKSQTYIFN